MWFGIPTPDQSLIPQLASLVGYGTAVAFGWLVHRQIDLLETWSRQWPMHLAGAVALTGVCLSIVGVIPAFLPAPPGARTLGFAAAYGLAIWCWSLAIIGVAARSSRRARHRALRRGRLYWIYLAHLPVVSLPRSRRAPAVAWSIKFP